MDSNALEILGSRVLPVVCRAEYPRGVLRVSVDTLRLCLGVGSVLRSSSPDSGPTLRFAGRASSRRSIEDVVLSGYVGVPGYSWRVSAGVCLAGGFGFRETSCGGIADIPY